MEIEDIKIDEAMKEASSGFPHYQCPDHWLDCNQARRIAEHFSDPTWVTLKTLTQELGEPTRHTSSHFISWIIPDIEGAIVLMPNAHSSVAKVGGRTVEGTVKNIGQLRRMLSVLKETNQ